VEYKKEDAGAKIKVNNTDFIVGTITDNQTMSITTSGTFSGLPFYKMYCEYVDSGLTDIVPLTDVRVKSIHDTEGEMDFTYTINNSIDFTLNAGQTQVVISVTGGNDVFVNDANHIFFSKNAAE
jgi:cytochrome c oxidase assembly protein Cox11